MTEEEAPSSPSSSSSWIYVNEGGQHAVFADRHSGRLLRIDKALLRGAVPTSTPSLHALLHPYVDAPERVVLDAHVLEALRVAACGRIPPRRRRDWEGPTRLPAGTGDRMPDYRGPGVGVEIKPKGGYMTQSLLVEEQRRHKYGQSRYQLLQELYRDGKVVKDWMHDDVTPTMTGSIPASHYDPVDLFSGNAVRMRQALRHLFACPQNNLQIWLAYRPVLWDHDWRAVGATLGLPTVSPAGQNEMTELLMELLVQILLREPFLSRVLELQSLDLLDTDGAILVFRRLVQLCDGDAKAAESLLNAFPDEWNDETDPRTIPFLASCPLPLPKETTQLAQLCTQLVSPRGQHGTSPQKVHQARQTIDALSLEECRYLLQAWLISLTMCDLTFFLHLQRPATPSLDCDDDDIRVLSLQQLHIPGRISFPPGKTELQYMLKAIDVDCKPARKIQSRYAKEVQFDRPGSS